MAKFDIYGQADFRTFNLYEFIQPGAIFFDGEPNSWKVSFNQGANLSVVEGFGFEYDSNGIPTTGTTTTATTYVAGQNDEYELFAKLTDISISTPQASMYIQSGNPQYVSADVFKGNDTITASETNDFNDYLNGYGGADQLTGYGGNDTYIVDDIGDMVIEAANGGSDTVLSSASYTLAANVENLTLTGTLGLKGTGNTLGNTITGNSGANTLDGLGGTDTLIGGAGSDTYLVDRAIDKVIEAAKQGTDTVKASVSYTLAVKQEIEILKTVSDSATTTINLTGNEYANTITGNAGANILSGGLGNDTLKGGSGKDTFFFNTKPSSTNLDHITDFRAVDDTIKLENSVFTALQAGKLTVDEFATITSKSAVVDGDAHILYEKASGTLYYDANGGTASGRVAFAVLDNHTSLTFQDFLVV